MPASTVVIILTSTEPILEKYVHLPMYVKPKLAIIVTNLMLMFSMNFEEIS